MNDTSTTTIAQPQSRLATLDADGLTRLAQSFADEQAEHDHR